MNCTMNSMNYVMGVGSGRGAARVKKGCGVCLERKTEVNVVELDESGD